MIKHDIALLFALFLIAADATAEKPVHSLYQKLQQQGVVYFQKADLPEKEWQVLVSHHRGQNILSVYNEDDRQLLYQYTSASPTDTFIRLQWVELKGSEPLLATVWQRGVHGEQFILLDPAEKKLLYRLASSWPLDFIACKQSIAVTIMKEGETVDTPFQETHVWHQSGSVEIKHGDISFCKFCKTARQ